VLQIFNIDKRKQLGNEEIFMSSEKGKEANWLPSDFQSKVNKYFDENIKHFTEMKTSFLEISEYVNIKAEELARSLSEEYFDKVQKNLSLGKISKYTGIMENWIKNIFNSQAGIMDYYTGVINKKGKVKPLPKEDSDKGEK
jgi:hypothetical protein